MSCLKLFDSKPNQALYYNCAINDLQTVVWNCARTPSIFNRSNMAVYFSDHVCIDDRFRCANDKCISMWKRCDRFQDCADGSDETDCAGKNVFHFPTSSNVYLMFKWNKTDIIRLRWTKPKICFKLLWFENDVLPPVEKYIVLHFVNNVVYNDVLPWQ